MTFSVFKVSIFAICTKENFADTKENFADMEILIQATFDSRSIGLN
jgi:hypothetical protein